jgi:hypothetical protein
VNSRSATDAVQDQFPWVRPMTKNLEDGMRPLPDFVARVQKVARAGFKNVYNITDGMEGDVVKSPDSVFRGQRLVNGWKNSGLPWTYDVEPTRMVLPAEQ